MPDVYDRVSIGDRTWDFPSGIDRFRQTMGDAFPAERNAIDRYIAAVLATVRASKLFYAEKSIPGPIARLLGGMMRAGFLRYASRTTLSVLREFTQNAELIAVLTGQWGDYGLPPGHSSFGAHAVVAHHYFNGAGYPAGGASEIAAGIAPVIEKSGGEILSSAEVSEILLEPGGSSQRRRAIGVRMADGRELRARTIISDAGAQNTFERLLPPDIAASTGILEEIETLGPSVGHVCLYVGVKRAPGEPDFEATNRWIYPNADHDGNFERFNGDPDGPWPCQFISFPSAKDPSFAARYPGRSTIEVIAPISYESFARWADTRWKKRGADYDQFKQSLADRLRADLERHVPETRGRIDFAEASTPLSTRHFANCRRGEIYGLSVAPARYRIRDLGPRTPVRDLYLAGADACGAGIAGAMVGGVLAASLILRGNLMAKITRPWVATRSQPSGSQSPTEAPDLTRGAATP
jgi:all-trans-retinol 13,14-reductase